MLASLDHIAQNARHDGARGREAAPRTKLFLEENLAMALELARQGRVDLRQDGAFEPLYLKAAEG